MFETFNVPSLYIINPANVSLYSFGRSTGVIVESGHEVTTVLPIYEGFPIPQNAKSTGLAGKLIT